MNAPVRTAILGYGRSGSSLHADPIEALDEFEMTAVCDIDREALEKAGKRFNCALYENYFEMLKNENLDLVVIVTRSDQHCQMVCDCLKAGVNVLVTKPWGLNEKEALRMIDAAERSGKLLLPWLPARWGCDFLRLKELIASGVIGKVFQIRRREYDFSIREDWQTQKKYGGGYLLNWGPHLIDTPVLLSGGKVKSVFGRLKQVINPGDVEDVFFAVLTMDDGTLIVSEHNVASPNYPNWVVQGERGTILVRETEIEIHKMSFPDKLDSESYGNKPVCEIIKDKVEEGHRVTNGNRYGDAKVIYPEIAMAVKGKKKYPVSLRSALELTRILDAVKISSEEDEIIQIN